MKHFSLLWKLLLLFVGVSVAMFVIMNTVGLNIMQNRMLARTKEELYQNGTSYVSDYLLDYYEKNGNNNALSIQFEVLSNMTEARIWLVSKNGLIVMDSARIANGCSLLEEDVTFFEETFQENVFFKGITREPMLSVSIPVIHEYSEKGHLVLLKEMDSIKEESIFYLDFANIAYLIFQPILLGVFLLIYRMTAVPVKQMAEAAKKFSRGNFKEPLELSASGEYLELANTIQYMGDKLKNTDDAQRKFVSNVSHDFRSPLTSIKGFLEAMQDGTIPPELYPKYIGIVLNETNRLIKLTNSLLTLNNLNTKGMILEKSKFDINQVIRNTVIAFEPSCIAKKIAVELILTNDTMMVEADMGKIQQVLYNLLDNAIKFSPTNSIIKIETYEKHNKIFVSVKDNGIGIPKESLKQIWSRFYKTDLSRGKDKKGTGLGLSIAKEIIQSHNENINVISTEGVGTEFVFSLPIVEDEEDIF